MDKFYTPNHVASNMVKQVKNKKRDIIIADFAAGRGELLRIAEIKWPKSKLIATDINVSSIRFLQKQHPNWAIGRCDFLSDKSRRKCRPLVKFNNKINLILLNPPFSNKGGKLYQTSFKDLEIRSSQAMAFLLTSINFLDNGGELVAILPSGSFSSERDRMAWSLLDRYTSYKIINTYNHNTFDNCYPTTHLIYFRLLKNEKHFSKEKKLFPQSKPKTNGKYEIRVQRGRFSMYKYKSVAMKRGVTLIHSTNLQNQEVINLDKKIRVDKNIIISPTILIPRVGKPTKHKVVHYNNRVPIILSDCVFAVSCRNKKNLIKIEKYILSNWNKLSKLYSGTCAPFLTQNNLELFLSGINLKNSNI